MDFPTSVSHELKGIRAPPCLDPRRASAGRRPSHSLAEVRRTNVLIHGRRLACSGRRRGADEFATTAAAPHVLMADLSDNGCSAIASLNGGLERLGGLDAWLHFAGGDTLPGTGRPQAVSFDAKLDRLWAVDVVATLRLTRAGRPLDEAARQRARL